MVDDIAILEVLQILRFGATLGDLSIHITWNSRKKNYKRRATFLNANFKKEDTRLNVDNNTLGALPIFDPNTMHCEP